MAELNAKKWAAIYANGDFICFETCSGLRSYARDPRGKLLFATSLDHPSILGEALVEALSVSRFLKPEELASFFDQSALERRYEDWVTGLVQKFGYASRRELFKQMKHCLVDQSAGVITLRPTNHEKLEAWSGDGIDKSQYVQIAQGSSYVEIGRGVLLALSRCIV